MGTAKNKKREKSSEWTMLIVNIWEKERQKKYTIPNGMELGDSTRFWKIT